MTVQAAAAAAPPAYGPGLLGFLVVAAIGVALYFLIKSMNKQMSKIEVPREDDDRERSEPGARPDGSR